MLKKLSDTAKSAKEKASSLFSRKTAKTVSSVGKAGLGTTLVYGLVTGNLEGVAGIAAGFGAAWLLGDAAQEFMTMDTQELIESLAEKKPEATHADLSRYVDLGMKAVANQAIAAKPEHAEKIIGFFNEKDSDSLLAYLKEHQPQLYGRVTEAEKFVEMALEAEEKAKAEESGNQVSKIDLETARKIANDAAEAALSKLAVDDKAPDEHVETAEKAVTKS